MQYIFLLPPVRIATLIGSFLICLAQTGLCQVQGTAALQEQIDQNDAGWIARDNEISQLPVEDRKKLLGTIIDREYESLVATSPRHFAAFASGPLPAKLDYRNINGKNYVTPVRDQGTCGSCWAFATTAALESSILRAYNRPGKDVDLAEQVLLSCSSAGGCGGGSPYMASTILKNTGIPPESCYPYTRTNGNCNNACSQRLSKAFTITGYVHVGPSVSELKAALNKYGPITTAYEVYGDFYKYDSGVYQHVSGEREGGHAVLLVGYDDEAQAFICKNSWGRNWGENGYFRIHYNMVNKGGVDFGIASYAYTGAIDPNVTNHPPRAAAGAVNDVHGGSRVILNAANSNDPDGDIVSYQWIQTSGPVVVLTDAGTPTPEFTAPDTDAPAGITLTFRLTVTDDDGATGNDSVSVRVLRNNQPPTAAANGSSPVTEGETVTLSGTNSTDPENGELTFHWSQLNGPEVVLSNAYAATCSFTAPDTDDPDGVYLTFRLTVTDDVNMSDQADVTVNVNWHNQPPEAVAGDDLHLSEGERVVLDGRGSVDPESHPLIFQWRQLSGKTVTLSDPQAAVAEFTAPTGPDTNGYALRFNLEVQDNGGLKATDEVIVNVSWVNDPPATVVTGPDTAVAGDVITLDGAGSSDIDDGIERYQWRQLAGPPVVLDTPDQSITTFTAPDPGIDDSIQLQFELTVTDAGGLAAAAGVNVTIYPEGADTASSPAQPGSTDQPNHGGGGSGSGCWIQTITALFDEKAQVLKPPAQIIPNQ